MDIPTFAQTLFYFVSSIAILVVGSVVVILGLQLISITKEIKTFTEKINQIADEMRTRVSNLFEKLSSLSLLSSLSEKFSGKKKHKKS